LAQDEQSTDSVFDFLYVDHVRIAIFFSQLPDETKGHLREVLSEDNSTSGFTSKLGVSALATGEIAASVSASGKQTLRYDPIWLHARTFLDVFDENGLLVRGDGEAKLNEVRLFNGQLSIKDMRIMKPFWSALVGEMAKSFILERQPAAKKGHKGKPPPPGLNAAIGKALGSFLDGMPQTVTGALKADVGRLWFTLRPENLVVPIEELLLKLGTQLPGTWHVVAIVDVIGANQFESADGDESIEAASTAAFEAMGTHFGRPADTIGVTPIMIFRKLPNPRAPKD
jgi:hypothetical protein